MKSKEKIKIIIVSLILIFILIGILYIYIKKSNLIVVYADSNVKTNEIKISNAKKINVEEIINENRKENNKEQIYTEQIDLEYLTIYKNNKDLPKGSLQVVQEGRTGIQQVTIKKTYNENKELHEEQLNSIIIKAAVNKIVEVGTSTTKYNHKIIKGSDIYVTSDRAELMRENNIQSDKITTISQNAQMKVIDVVNDWYKVFFNGQVGWIKSENVANVIASEEYQINNSNISKLDFNMNLNRPSGLTLEQFKKVLNDSKDVNKVFTDNAEYFYYIEKQYNINGLFVAAIGIHESAWGTSKISLNKKNLFGYGAYDSSPYKSSYNFESYSEGIDLIARVLVKYYLNPKGTAIYGGEIASGKYYSGDTLTSVNKKYATDKNWAKKVYNYMEYLYKKI